jgi:uncharacterized protein
MLKFALIIIVLITLWFVLFRKPNRNARKNCDSSHTSRDEEVMVQCAQCQTYVSHKEALIRNGQFFCSNTCLDHA